MATATINAIPLLLFAILVQIFNLFLSFRFGKTPCAIRPTLSRVKR